MKIKLIDLLKEEDKKKYICCKVNNIIRHLNYVIDDSEKDKVEFLDLTNTDAMKIYERSLRLMLAKIVYDINPKWRLKFSYSVSRTIYLQLFTSKGEQMPINSQLLHLIKEKLDELILKDVPIERDEIEISELKKIYKKEGFLDKLELLKQKKTKTQHIYKIGDYINYMYGYTVISTGYITNYRFKKFAEGFVIQYPRAEEKGTIPEFEESPTYSKTLNENATWGKLVGADTIYKINNYIKDYGACDFINMCESHHNNMLAELGNMIKYSDSDIRLICIAGPSSSGKTTFANRLRLELMSKGLNPVRISIDDYYLPREQCPLDEEGKVDLETINSLNIKQFNKDITALIEGETVSLPIFDFKTKKHLKAAPIKLDKNQIIIIEGIHALNDKLTPSIPRHQKFKIYIAPQAQINIDDHNPISLTDLRLLRRIVRDYRSRNASAEDTIRMWPSVRKGEFKWIYATQEGADFVFNSLLPYELNVMKEHALPILNEVKEDSDCFTIARKLEKFLELLIDIEDKYIPNNSLMREFIGGSCFYDADC